MKILINGGCGFLGSNLASYGIRQGHEITIFDKLFRLGSASNLEWLKLEGDFTYLHGDVRNRNDVIRYMGRRTILAAQWNSLCRCWSSLRCWKISLK